MSSRSERLRAKNKLNRKTTPLGLEQLESRMMNAVGGIEQNLQLLLNNSLLGSTQIISPANVSSSNAAPTVRSQPRLASGTEVRTQTSVVSVVGADDQGEPNLVYTWQATTKPNGSTVSFATNGDNASKRNTATFSKAGAYTLSVSIRDASGLTTTSTLQFNVVQTLTTLRLADASGASIDPSSTQTVAGSSLQVQLRGFDQFGHSMATLPAIGWSRVSSPSRGSIVATDSNGSTTLTFNRIGEYVVRAKSGVASVELRANVEQVLTSIGVRGGDNRLVSAGSGASISGVGQTWTAIAFDQFGGAMTQQPTIGWSTVTKPTSATPSLQSTGNAVNITFDQSGAYSFHAQVGSVAFNLNVSVVSVLTQISLFESNGNAIDSEVAITTSRTSQSVTVRGVDQFGNAMSSLPVLVWSTVKVPSRGTATGTLNAGVATISFTRAGEYTLRVRGGNANRTFIVNVAQTLTSIVSVGANGRVLDMGSRIAVNGTSQIVRGLSLDQFGQSMSIQPSLNWTSVSVPTGGAATFETGDAGTTVAFTRAGIYSIRASSGSISMNVGVSVVQRLVSMTLTPGSASVQSGASQQFVVQGTDQFQQSMNSVSGLVWTTTAGTISSSGLLTAGTRIGTFSVTAKAGTVSAVVSVSVAAANPQAGINDSTLKNLITSLNADNSITRAEMIQILRSAGDDGSVSQAELNDLRLLVTPDSGFKMPSYVRELARDVVNDNRANLKYQGQTAGNLVAGSSSSLLNKLVDKWFLGSDEPVISGSGLTYQLSSGNLFNGTPSRADAKQGYLGDCYFIASVTSIADKSAEAVRNMFIDNGDGTFTVRFFATSADYVTVNRRLPAYANGRLAYSGVGQLVASASTTLWVALAEKAYAQWNETGNSGRNGTNTYSSIEGGWMSNVNRQVLGYNSSNYSFSSTDKQTLINAIGAGRAVTLGTNSNSSGLVGSHAYIVTGYDASSDRFTLHNPWGTSHPSPLSWDHLRANCSMFVVTESGGTTPISNVSVRSSMTDVLAGNWTTVVTGVLSVESGKHLQSDVSSLPSPTDLIDSLAKEVDEAGSEWVTLAEGESNALIADESESSGLNELRVLTVDLAMSMEHLDSILG
jgi:hypothetical protein